MQASPTTMREVDNSIVDRTQQPQNSIDQINPNSILHTYNPSVPLSIFLDEHLPKDTKDCYPENTTQKKALAKQGPLRESTRC